MRTSERRVRRFNTQKAFPRILEQGCGRRHTKRMHA